MSRADYDVAVLGGGPAGAAAAIMLVRAGLPVLLVDQTARNLAFKPGEGLPGAVQPLLRDLGALDRFLSEGHRPCLGNETAWGRSETVIHDFIRDPNGHGWHLDRVRFDSMMRCLAQDAGARLLPSSRLQSFARDSAQHWHLTIEAAGQRIQARARWLVDATGRTAYLARQLGVATLHANRQIAWTALYALSPDAPDDQDHFTLVEAAPDGWWYTAPLPGRSRVVAFFTDNDLPAAAGVSTPAGFSEALSHTNHVRRRLPAYQMALPPRGGPASDSRISQVYGDGWVAAGDAALAFDPLSSHGIFTALYGGLRVAGALRSELAGTGGGLAGFAEDLDRVHEAYRRNRQRIYAQEQRWTVHDFWRRRTSPSAPVAG